MSELRPRCEHCGRLMWLRCVAGRWSWACTLTHYLTTATAGTASQRYPFAAQDETGSS